MNNWKKTFGIHICCSVLVAAFLLAVPILSSSHGGASEEAIAADTCVNNDPLGRLPSTPEEAHQRIEEREFVWPEDTAGGDFGAATVQAGVRVAIPYDSVEGFTDHANTQVKVELFDGGMSLKETKYPMTGSDGWFKADMSAGDILSGDTVVVTDLGGGAGATINCTLTANLDFANEWVTGTTVGTNAIDAYLIAPSTYYGDIPPGAVKASTTAAAGAYTATFAGIDTRTGDAAFVFSTDASGNTVMNAATSSGGGLVVYPQYDDVMGFYTPGSALAITAGSATLNVTTMTDGFFEAWFAGHDIIPGETVSTNMGGARGIIVRDVSASCDPAANVVDGIGPASRPIRVTMDPYGTPVIYQTTTNTSGNFSVALGAGFTATGTEVFSVTWYDDDGDCCVYEFQTFSWYLAEGYTGGDFDTWVLVQNPGPYDASVVLTFQLTEGSAPAYYLNVLAGTRQSIHLDELSNLADAQVSTKVTSTMGNCIIAERAEYFIYDGKQGGSDSIGALTPSTTWYLAEGYTGNQFDTWVLVQNPGTEMATITLDFQLVKGSAQSYTFQLPGGMRRSVHLDELPGLADAEVSTKVTSDKTVVAERAEYFEYDGKEGGHDSIGVIAPSDTWYLAEGYTGGDFDTWVLVQNPGPDAAVVTMEFQLQNGIAQAHTFTLPTGKRQSVHLDDLPDLSDAQVSTKVTATDLYGNPLGVVAERAEYFTYDGKEGGHDSIGTPTPASTWYLAEGYTGGQFDTWVLVQNPGTETARVTLSFQLVEGAAQDYSFDLAGGKRQSIHLDELNGLANAQVSTKVTATNQYGTPLNVVAERAEYFIYEGKQGGHDSIGVPEVF